MQDQPYSKLFNCPKCQEQKLDIIKIGILGYEADDMWDENTIQILQCQECKFKAVGLYQEEHRGQLDDETWQHRGFFTPVEKIQKLETQLDQLPNQRDENQTININDFIKDGDKYYQSFILN